ncbi:unnamed protein product [Ceratitis capitata]|uniref:(Mediterranean fruit fly) hypothetical protein n=1 Tax=Ceratitis capitata TaxID=7213 RepID=A0A811V2G8_CERCA|nr:unnamed protein product [Ceratitis capitata]
MRSTSGRFKGERSSSSSRRHKRPTTALEIVEGEMLKKHDKGFVASLDQRHASPSAAASASVGDSSDDGLFIWGKCTLFEM